jgi:sporulation protein YlmC with PRC-barrel domain
MRLGELLASKVVTESGKKLGHVFDVRVSRGSGSSAKGAGGSWRIDGLLVGSRGVLERFGFTRNELAGPRHAHDAIPWSAVVKVKDGLVTVREGTELAD